MDTCAHLEVVKQVLAQISFSQECTTIRVPIKDTTDYMVFIVTPGQVVMDVTVNDRIAYCGFTAAGMAPVCPVFKH
jgi:hypothetical protein